MYDDYRPFDLHKEFDEESYIHDFRHAAALERALASNATSQEEKDIYTYVTNKDKKYHLDWKNVQGPGSYDNDTPVYYRDMPVFPVQQNKT